MWLVKNEFEETFLLFQVFVKIYVTFEAFLKFFLAQDEARVKIKNVKYGRDKHEK